MVYPMVFFSSKYTKNLKNSSEIVISRSEMIYGIYGIVVDVA